MTNLNKHMESALLPQGASMRDSDSIIAGIAKRTSTLGVELAGVAGDIADTSGRASTDEQRFESLNTSMEGLQVCINQIEDTCRKASETSELARGSVEVSVEVVEQSLLAMKQQIAETRAISEQLQELQQALLEVQAVSGDIDDIASKTNLLAMNATIEAARAGDAGRGFAVVASEVKALAGQTQKATGEISGIVDNLGSLINGVSEKVDVGVRRAEESQKESTRLVEAVQGMQQAMTEIGTGITEISDGARTNMDSCRSVTKELAEFALQSEQNRTQLSEAADKVGGLLGIAEELIEFQAESGIEIEDSKFINHVKDAAATISKAFSDAVESGRVSMEALFDRNYDEIPGTDPVQYRFKALDFVDDYLPSVQEPALDLDDKVIFCAAVDVNGYLPTHNLKFAKPQGTDPVWNNANCRNRRIFNDKTGLSAGQNTRPFLLQTYRRDMGGGKFVLMKDVSAPIIVNGRHWGGLRLAYGL